MNNHSKSALKSEYRTEFQDRALGALAIPSLLCIYLLITSTRYLSSSLAVFDVKRMIEIIMFGVILLIAIIDPKLRMELAAQFRRIPLWIGLGFLGIISLGVISSVINATSSFALAYSLAEVYILMVMIVLGLVVAACRSIAGTRFDQLVMFCLVMLGLAVGLQELIGVAVAWSAGLQFSYDVALTHFAHARFYNQLQSWTVPLLAALPVVFSRHRLAALFCIPLLGLHWYILLMTGARGSTLSLLVAFGVSLLLFPGARRLIVKWQSAGIVVGVLIYFLMFLGPATGRQQDIAATQPAPATGSQAAQANPGAVDLPEEKTSAQASRYFKFSLGRPMLYSSGRTAMWSAAMANAAENPLLGIGPMNYACKGEFYFAAHPHNSALQLLSEWGFPATLLVLGVLFTLLGRLLARLRAGPDPQGPAQWLLQVMLMTSVVAAVLHSVLSGLLVMPASQVAGVLVCGWLLGSLSPAATRVTGHPGEHNGRYVRYASTTVLVISLMATLVIWLFAIQEIKKMTAYEDQLPVIEWGTPRFWNSGKVCSLNMQAE